MNTRGYVAMAALMVGACGLAQAEDLPKRKPGLWEFAMQMEGMPAGMPGMKSQHCVDEKSDQEMQRKAMTNADPKQQCTQGTPKRVSGGMEVETTCKGTDGSVHVRSRITGDMSSNYVVDSTMKFTPPRHGMSESRMQIKANYGGACPAGMKPGEVRMGGMSFNPAQGSMDMKNMDPEALKKWAEQMEKAQPRK
ncbi:MAG: DUF3617 domain-containing protein [Aquabacterium sp.]|nr:DUF3617 domain-containing protein [Aquabacterium sp.]